jgi:hypothetical protein
LKCFEPDHGYLTPQNGYKKSKYIACDSTLQINMLYGTILFKGKIQGKTLGGEMWNGG